MSLLTSRGSVVDVNRSSTFYNEDLGDLVDLRGHGTRANADLYEIIQGLGKALSLL